MQRIAVLASRGDELVAIAVQGRAEDLQAGIDVLRALTQGMKLITQHLAHLNQIITFNQPLIDVSEIHLVPTEVSER